MQTTTAPAQRRCRHCTTRAICKPRGLCYHCYLTPGVRELFPPTSKFARRGAEDFCGRARLAAAPTTAAPGSPDKVRILEERADRGEALFHPHDAGSANRRWRCPAS